MTYIINWENQQKSKPEKDWSSKVDWSKRDNRIAKELGLSRERIRQVRMSLNLPSSATLPKPEKIFKINLQNADWTKTNAEICRENKISMYSAASQRKYWAPHTVREYALLRKIMQNMDYSLPQKKIQDFLWQNHNIKICQTSISRYKRIYAPNLIVKKNGRAS